jgi:endogenous inhibitor of DNA gyrase (YacG/DUF329 family)
MRPDVGNRLGAQAALNVQKLDNSAFRFLVAKAGLSSAISMSNATRIKCPTCKRRGDWFATPFGPFCSKRCKLIDLGKWFGEEHAISEPLSAEALRQLADQQLGELGERPDANENH